MLLQPSHSSSRQWNKEKREKGKCTFLSMSQAPVRSFLGAEPNSLSVSPWPALVTRRLPTVCQAVVSKGQGCSS